MWFWLRLPAHAVIIIPCTLIQEQGIPFLMHFETLQLDRLMPALDWELEVNSRCHVINWNTDTNTIQPLVEICTSRVDGLGICVNSSLHAMCIFFISNSLLKCTKCTLAKCNNLYERCARSTVWELVCTICSMQRSYQKDWILCWNTRP